MISASQSGWSSGSRWHWFPLKKLKYHLDDIVSNYSVFDTPMWYLYCKLFINIRSIFELQKIWYRQKTIVKVFEIDCVNCYRRYRQSASETLTKSKYSVQFMQTHNSETGSIHNEIRPSPVCVTQTLHTNVSYMCHTRSVARFNRQSQSTVCTTLRFACCQKERGRERDLHVLVGPDQQQLPTNKLCCAHEEMPTTTPNTTTIECEENKRREWTVYLLSADINCIGVWRNGLRVFEKKMFIVKWVFIQCRAQHVNFVQLFCWLQFKPSAKSFYRVD